jgi:hypothetical protein
VNVEPRGLEIVTEELNIDVAPRKHNFVDLDPNLYRELKKVQGIGMNKFTSHYCMTWSGGLMRYEAVDSNDTNEGQGISLPPVASKKPPPAFREENTLKER